MIDGNSLAYRAFFALPETMRTAKGLPTNALYGFTTMLLKILDDKPDAMAVAFDMHAPTFRHKEYKEYKGTRDKAPDALITQLGLVRTLVETLGITVFEKEGFEADDIIGTLARQGETGGYNVMIVTGDLDALQLVTDHVKVYTTRKGISDVMIYDIDSVKNRYGITPEQVVDYKALKGDTSDNIPGVPGIGEKTAVQLIQEYGTLEEILKNVEKISNKRAREALETKKAMGVLSKWLATIVTDVPLKTDLPALTLKPINWNKVIPLFEELEFRTLIKKYGSEQAPTLFESRVGAKQERVEALDTDYETVTDAERLARVAEILKKSGGFAFDTETTSIDSMRAELVGLSVSAEAKKAFYIPVHHLTGKQLPWEEIVKGLGPIFADRNIPKYGQHLKYDLEILRRHGMDVAGIAFDTMIAAYTLFGSGQKIGLKYLGEQFLGREMLSFEDLRVDGKKIKSFAEVDAALATTYAAADADVTYQLAQIFMKKIREEKLTDLFEGVEMPLMEVLTDMEMAGVYVDAQKLEILSTQMGTKMAALEKDITAIAGEEFNLNSPKQLQEILFGKLKMPAGKKTKTGVSTDASVLEKLAPDFEIAAKLLEYRFLSKLKSTYVDALPELIHPDTGRIHTSFNQTIAATGRLSSTNPNLQNIPARSELGREIRDAFVAQNPGDVLMSADYSQVELRILAHLSEDRSFTSSFMKDEDIHRATAAEVFGIAPENVTKEMRDSAKRVNFGIIYGMSAFGLAKDLNIPQSDAQSLIDKYFLRYPKVKEYMDTVIRECESRGYVVTLLNRRRYIPEINSKNISLRQFAQRQAINTPVQGSAADMLKLVMIRVDQAMIKERMKARLLITVHDELVFETPAGEEKKLVKLIKEIMEHPLDLTVPIKVTIRRGKNWLDLEPTLI